MPSAKEQFKVLRPFRRNDPKTGLPTRYAPDGTPYPGPVDKPFYLSAEGPDGKGPLVAEIAASTPTAAAVASGDPSKEK